MSVDGAYRNAAALAFALRPALCLQAERLVCTPVHVGGELTLCNVNRDWSDLFALWLSFAAPYWSPYSTRIGLSIVSLTVDSGDVVMDGRTDASHRSM